MDQGQNPSHPQSLLSNPMAYPGLVVRKAADVAVMVLRRPSFDPEASWTLLHDDNQWYVRRVIAAVNAGPLAAKLDPDTFGSEGTLPRSEADRLLTALHQLRIKPFPKPDGGIVLDGCRYEIRRGGRANGMLLEWHGEAPPEWVEIRDWYANAVAVFQAHLPEPTLPIQVIHPWCE